MSAIHDLTRAAGLGGHLLLYLLAGASAILLLAGVAVLMLRRQSAAIRHCVWTLSMIALLILPALASVLPHFGPRWQPDESVATVVPRGELEQNNQFTPVATEWNAALRYTRDEGRPDHRQPPEGQPTPSLGATSTAGESPPAVASSDDLQVGAQTDVQQASPFTSPDNINTPAEPHATTRRAGGQGWIALVGVWLTGVVIALLLFVRCRWAAIRVVRRAVLVTDAEMITLMEEFRKSTEVRSSVSLLCNPEIAVPLTVGWLRPAILLPAGFARWTEEQRRVVLAHEMAHIRRRDVLWELLARLACCLYWCHPLVWLAHWRIRVEREFACDDAVLTMGEVPDRYAEQLVEFGAALAGRSRPPRHAVAMAARSSLEHRVRAILHPCLKRTPVTRRARRLLAIGALLLVVGVSLLSPSTRGDADARPLADDSNETVAPEEETTGGEVTDESPKEDSAPQIAADGSVATTGKMRLHLLAPDGSPLEGVKIKTNTLANTEPPIINLDYVSDSDGLAEIQLPDSLIDLRMWVRRNGYAPMWASWRPKDHPEDAPIPEEFTFRFPERTVIGGIVRNEDGDPIEGVTVGVAAVSLDDVRPHLGGRLEESEGSGVLTTDADGRWVLHNAPPDNVEFRVFLSHPDYIDDVNRELQREQWVTTQSFYDQTAVIVMQRGISLTGQITDPDGEPIAGALAIWGERPYWQTGSQEVRTDENGIYRLPALPPGTIPLTIVAEGWMPQMHTIDIEPAMSAMDFELALGRKLRLRFVDPSGNPVPDVYVAVKEWRGLESLYNMKHSNVLDSRIPRRADADGVYEWSWAPDDAVTYSFGAVEGFARMEPSITADGTEQIITLQPLLHVSGTVTDALTAQPVETFEAVPVIYFTPDFLYVNRDEAVEGHAGRLEIPFERTDIEHGVRIEAEGYRTLLLGPWKVGDPNPTPDVALEPAPPIRGVVVHPDGRPAADAAVYLATYTQELDIQNHNDGDSDLFVRKTNANGSFSFPAQYEPYALIVIDDAGYMDIQCWPDEQPGELQLRPWARVEGRLMHGAAPVPGQRVTLRPLHPRFFPQPWINETFWQTTDQNGRFVFERVPPVKCALSGYLTVWDEFPFTSSESVSLDLQPGENRTIDLNGEGAEVTGRVVLSGRTRREIDLNYSLNYLVALRDGIEPPPAVAEKGFDWRNGWSDAWTSSPEGLSYLATLHQYFVKLNRDGTFHISGVPPGEYELALKIYEPPDGGCLVEPVATQQIRFAVTDEHVTTGLDLGELKVEAFLGPEPGEPAPNFTFETPEGATRSLSDLQGKYVLIDFWATWCAPCVAKLPVVRELHDEFAGENLVVLGMNLDADKEKARQFVSDHELSWTQGFLGEWSESTVPVQYGISSIPVYVLIGPDGTFLHKGYDAAELRGMLGERVKTTSQ